MISIMDDAYFLLKEKYGGRKTPSYESDAARLAAGEPLAYLIGWVPFLDTTIYLDSRPLIPRTETEFWVEKAIKELLKASESGGGPLRILDLFAGSGAVGIAVLSHLPSAKVDFGEIAERHFPTIARNVSENGIDANRVRIIKTDVWNGITDRYDAILANPPYLDAMAQERIGASVLEYEPHEALFSSENGTELIRKTVGGASLHLKSGGFLYIEHEPEQSGLVAALAGESGMSANTCHDQYGVIRYSILRAP